ncbi:HAD family hydrolase [Butyrivibrio sp. VCD2006]|uniref:HAD family hydrolase n=1 Tax=Butyrivibrio sp. VCD2006 TaxID=1280664 RepID=UPI0006861F9A|nr:HAD family phosphatase [Butyrivibrio sp. VCD2006]
MEKSQNNKSGGGGKTPIIRRVLAILGIIILLGVNIVFFLKAVRGTFDTTGAFMTSAASTVAIPIIVWLFVWAFTAVTGKRTVASSDPYGKNEEAAKEDTTEEKAEDNSEEEESQKEDPDKIDMEASIAETKEKDSAATKKERSPAKASGNAKNFGDGKIDTVIFDIGGVLADFCWEEFIKDKGYVEDTVDKIADASIRSDAWNEFDRGVLDTNDVIKEFVKNDPNLQAELYDCFSDLTGLLRKRERSIPWIKALKAAGYKVLVLSNYSKQAEDTNPFMKEFLAEVDGGILSYKEQIIKPDRKIYELICDRYDLYPNKCVFIDDTAKNVDAAREFGMKAILFESYEQVDRELAGMGVTYKISE